MSSSSSQRRLHSRTSHGPARNRGGRANSPLECPHKLQVAKCYYGGAMVSALRRFLGPSPRVRVLEAVVHLASINFNAAQIARATGLQKSSAYTHMRKLAREGYLAQVTDQRPVVYALNETAPEVRLFYLFKTALDAVDARRDSDTPSATPEILESFATAAQRTVAEGEPRPVAATSPFRIEAPAPSQDWMRNLTQEGPVPASA